MDPTQFGADAVLLDAEQASQASVAPHRDRRVRLRNIIAVSIVARRTPVLVLPVIDVLASPKRRFRPLRKP